MQQLKLVSDTKKVTKAEVAALVEKIKANEIKPSTTFLVEDYYEDNAVGIKVPNMDKRYQARGFEINHSFCQERATYIENTGDFSELNPSILLSNFNSEGLTLCDGNHSAEICLLVDKKYHDAIVIDYYEDLGGEIENLARFANLMNNTKQQKQPLSVADIRAEVDLMLDGKLSRGEELSLTSEEWDDLRNTYPQVTKKTIIQWVAYHRGGGRQPAQRQYTTEQLNVFASFYESSPMFEDYCVLSPRTIPAWNGEALSAMFLECLKTGKNKALIPLYAQNLAQENRMKKMKASGSAQEVYTSLAKRFGLDDIQVLFIDK